MNTLEASGKIEYFSKKWKAIENVMENEMEILELTIMTHIPCSVDGLDNRIEETEEKISELGDKTIKITQSEHKETHAKTHDN